ncbi:hypothetical protein cce_2002 [Crocosphaera subtropica ATCC 51142]|uniref:Uncharacterized protein n=1 Tax=Crocosphaera subtropica (strain ATCC 51142 / BH68) TaxID=43989 RepID=B1X1C3_CROS5|nr:hypothetical protein [Crocosphaera subtropica]ACB51352.1 hypothetical protein cce_2002 [Crocosphaera subtropica ATCC 51142]
MIIYQETELRFKPSFLGSETYTTLHNPYPVTIDMSDKDSEKPIINT